MSLEQKEFKIGSSTINVEVRKKDSIRHENSVNLTWFGSGYATIEEARHFKNELAKAIAEAEYQQSKLED